MCGFSQWTSLCKGPFDQPPCQTGHEWQYSFRPLQQKLKGILPHLLWLSNSPSEGFMIIPNRKQTGLLTSPHWLQNIEGILGSKAPAQTLTLWVGYACGRQRASTKRAKLWNGAEVAEMTGLNKLRTSTAIPQSTCRDLFGGPIHKQVPCRVAAILLQANESAPKSCFQSEEWSISSLAPLQKKKRLGHMCYCGWTLIPIRTTK